MVRDVLLLSQVQTVRKRRQRKAGSPWTPLSRALSDVLSASHLARCSTTICALRCSTPARTACMSGRLTPQRNRRTRTRPTVLRRRRMLAVRRDDGFLGSEAPASRPRRPPPPLYIGVGVHGCGRCYTFLHTSCGSDVGVRDCREPCRSRCHQTESPPPGRCRPRRIIAVAPPSLERPRRAARARRRRSSARSRRTRVPPRRTARASRHK